MQVLNSPLELGVRSLVVLTSVFPRPMDISRLVLMDHCLLHSADLGGPESILPAVPMRSGELGVKRTLIERGVQFMVHAGMVDVLVKTEGLLYKASEQAVPFLKLLRSPYTTSLNTVADWVAFEFGELDEQQIRNRMADVIARWSEEFDWPRGFGSENGTDR